MRGQKKSENRGLKNGRNIQLNQWFLSSYERNWCSLVELDLKPFKNRCFQNTVFHEKKNVSKKKMYSNTFFFSTAKNLKNRVLEHILPCVIRISSSAVIFTIKTYFWKGLRSSKIIQLEQALSGDFRELSLAVFGLLEAKIGLTRPVQPLVLTYGNWEKSSKI